jgi:hypothetical protein
MKFEIVLEFTDENGLDESTVDSLIVQINEVVAAAVEDKQIEIPNAEIVDYGIGRIIEW